MDLDRALKVATPLKVGSGAAGQMGEGVVGLKGVIESETSLRESR